MENYHEVPLNIGSSSFSSNELSAIMKNTIEYGLLLNRIKILKNEHKQNMNSIKKKKINTEILLDAIRITTGSAYEKIEKLFDSTTSSVCFLFSLNNFIILKRSLIKLN
jgi:hypothetical protein